ncbi:MAG: ImmA/IrrE family metallo-endopeptidase [Proteobacteria bacterium]|nr:ImmA/IrrE family metallo-endopeptidase [Pseudomonadota bacterium]
MSIDRTIDQVPFLSAEKVENLAGELREKANCINLINADEVIARVLEYLKNNHHIHIDLNADMGKDLSGKLIVGMYNFNPPAIMVNQELLTPTSKPFTIGHEIGHCILHRNVTIRQEDYDKESLIDTEYDWAKGRIKITTGRDRLEWQANRFSASLLMPAIDFINGVKGIQRKIGINRNFGQVYLSDATSIRDFEIIKNTLSNIFGVSPTAIEFRMKDLSLIFDLRRSRTSHISTIYD